MKTKILKQNCNNLILQEQIRILYLTLPQILAFNFIASLSLIFVLWNVVSGIYLAIWFGSMFIILSVRFSSYFVYLRLCNAEKVKNFTWCFICGSALTGSLWGVTGLVLFPAGDLNYQLFLVFVLIILATGSVSALTTYFPAFFAYYIPALLPIALRLIYEGNQIQTTMGFMILIFIVGIGYFGMNIYHALKSSFKYRFENMELLVQLREQKNEAENANIAKSKFLAAASHDLRQPLHALSLFTSVLDANIQYPKVRRVVEQINISVQALQNLFNALLDISRLDAGVMQVDKIDFPLEILLNKLANDFNPQAHEKGLQVNWPLCSFSVHSDPALLEQILRNYLSNALRYTSHGSITINCRPTRGRLEISVTDTGIGIPAEKHKMIFEEFSQLSNQERDRSKGLGLGLAIVERTALLLDHSIEVDSQAGQGATFSVILDYSEVEIEPSVIKSVSTNHLIKIVNTLILVIDDEASIREGTKNLLEIWGSDVLVAVDHFEALELLKLLDRAPDGIIADYGLRKNLTGVVAIQAIHAEYSCEIPALIVTGDISVERLRDVNNSGFQILHKPVEPLKLHTFLRNAQLHKNKTQQSIVI